MQLQRLSDGFCDIKRTLLAWLITRVAQLLLATIKVTYKGHKLQGGGVVAFLHGEQLPLLLNLPSGPKLTPVSLSADGQLQVRVMSQFNIESVRGSHSRGALTVARQLRTQLSKRNDLFVLIAVDGPRGPYGRPHQGAAYLATSLNRPMWLCRARCERAWRLSSWDRFVIPKPFSHITITTEMLYKPSPDQPSQDGRATHQQLEARLQATHPQPNP